MVINFVFEFERRLHEGQEIKNLKDRQDKQEIKRAHPFLMLFFSGYLGKANAMVA